MDLTAVRAAGSRGGHRGRPKRGARRSSRRRWPIVTTSLVVLLAVVLGGGYVAWRWSQDQYYIGADNNGQVLIYRGVNERIVGVSLSHPYRQTGIRLAQVPAPYQQTVKATDAASSLHDAQAIVANVRSAVTTCHQEYTALQGWVTQENAYQAALTQFNKNKKPAKDKPKPPPAQPAKPAPMCPASTAFGIPASALVPAPSGSA
jgi:protein phosphatase